MELRDISCIDFGLALVKKKLLRIKIIWKKVLDYETLKESIVAHCLNAAEKIRLIIKL